MCEFVKNPSRKKILKKLETNLIGNNELVKNFCQCIREIIEFNAPNKEYKPDKFFIMGDEQYELEPVYSRLEKLSKNEIKLKDMESISREIKTLDKIFKTTDFNEKFAPRIEALSNEQSQEKLSELIKEMIEKIREKYPINENFKKQFEEFESNIKKHDETRKVFEEKKKSLIKEIESCFKDECNSEDEQPENIKDENIKDLLKNIKQTCESYIASHSVTDVFKDEKYMICKICLNQIDLLWDPKIKLYKHRKLLKSAEKSLWESIKILDNESGAHLFPKNPKEIKEKFEANKEKLEQSKTWSEFMQYRRECNPYI
ncbi:hypothetical protein COL0001_02240 [Helicobacter pylori]